LPSNVAISAASIYSYAHARYGDGKAAQLHFDNDNWGADTRNFICIGGPFVNEVAREVVEVRRVPSFEITDTPIANDENDSYAPERAQPVRPDAPLITDYGFVIYTKNPRNIEKRICLVFGLWPPGTEASVKVILNPRTRPRRLYRKLHRAIKSDHNVIAIVKVRVAGLALDQGEIVKVRLF
jgi:hypothetical protein